MEREPRPSLFCLSYSRFDLEQSSEKLKVLGSLPSTFSFSDSLFPFRDNGMGKGDANAEQILWTRTGINASVTFRVIAALSYHTENQIDKLSRMMNLRPALHD